MAQGKGTGTLNHSTSPAKAPVQPKIQWKNQRAFRHDLFKLELAKMKKNTSWIKARPNLIDAEHVHFYHSHSSSGTAQKYSVSVGGHFHEITPFIDSEGNLAAKCGPALRKVDKKLSNGTTKTIIEPIVYRHEEEGEMRDDHTHEITYMASETMSPQKVKQIQQSNAQGVSSMVEKSVDSEPALVDAGSGESE